ncbi:hypothetical protein GFK91_30320 (plasmid) [Roseibium aggregatum]|uniref:hypothetical protein n=1 Tax=Roseibium aggregatum TaxID=187304 RepID=UPI001E2D7EBC|nr:hypothetical protein [Roseibium aggregatum]UES60045.1 hypothetical protein GFK91_30320 [Roseibium aggregatum]
MPDTPIFDDRANDRITDFRAPLAVRAPIMLMQRTHLVSPGQGDSRYSFEYSAIRSITDAGRHAEFPIYGGVSQF